MAATASQQAGKPPGGHERTATTSTTPASYAELLEMEARAVPPVPSRRGRRRALLTLAAGLVLMTLTEALTLLLTAWEGRDRSNSVVDATVAALNEEWSSGGGRLGGLLVHVLDGPGITCNGFAGLAAGQVPSATSLWVAVGQPDATKPTGDRLAASIINRERNATYSMGLWAELCPSLGALADFYALPSIVLNASALLDRWNCCYWADGGTMRHTCLQLGGRENCTPGCRFTGPETKWTGHLAHRLDDVSACLTTDGDEKRGFTAAWGAAQWNVSTAIAERMARDPAWTAYNEVVLDVWRGGGWGKGPQLRSLVNALSIDAGATEAALALAHEVQRAARADGVSLPLLLYDRMRTSPFRVL